MLAGLALSLLAHALAAMLLMGIHFNVPEPPVTPIEVELVPPEEKQVPEQTPPEAEQPEQPEQSQEQEKPQEQPAAEAPPPPPPPPPPAEQAKAQEQPAEAEVPVLQPVQEFGEEDTGPKDQSESPDAQAQTTEDRSQPQEPDEAAAAPGDGPGDPSDAAEQVDAEQTVAEVEDTAEPEPQPDQPADQQTAPEAAADQQAVQEDQTPEEDFGTVGPIVTAALPAPKPPAPRRPAEGETSGGGGGQGSGSARGMTAARELYSQDILNDPRARTAMRGMPEGQRLNLLCMTELRAQLTVASPAPPELLPSFRPRGGTVLEPARAAFRMGGRWFDVAFRCETDGEVTRVRTFSYRIGKLIPPGQWAERGLSGF